MKKALFTALLLTASINNNIFSANFDDRTKLAEGFTKGKIDEINKALHKDKDKLKEDNCLVVLEESNGTYVRVVHHNEELLKPEKAQTEEALKKIIEKAKEALKKSNPASIEFINGSSTVHAAVTQIDGYLVFNIGPKKDVEAFVKPKDKSETPAASETKESATTDATDKSNEEKPEVKNDSKNEKKEEKKSEN